MTRSPDYQKWQLIYYDYQKGMKWEEIVQKHKTSKRTISKAINYYEGLVNNELSQDYIYNMAKQITKTIEALNTQTRIRLISVLVTYNELSLNRLSKKLGLSKPTVLRHLRDLEEVGIIKINRVGPRSKQYYSVSPLIRNTSDQTKLVRLTHSMLRNIPPEEALEALIIDLQADASFFSIIKVILDDVISYNKELQENLKEFRPTNYDTIEKLFSPENHYRYLFWYLNKAQYQRYRLRYREFLEVLRKDFKKIAEEDESSEEEHPYFVFHSLFPLKKIFDKKS
jgi:DNA-binding transcriptional ArsR family regulator